MDKPTDTLFNAITGPAWKTVGVHPHHGINLPLSSLHSKYSCGIGEFLDLIPLIDWCHRLKIDVIQLLPLNNSEGDPSPYNSFSSCALNIIYLSLHALPYLEKYPQLQLKLAELTQLNATNRVAYLEVFTHKISWLHAYFDVAGDKIVKSDELKHYISKNPWVEHYALYRTLIDRLGGTSSASWPSDARSPNPEEFQALLKRHWPEVSFYIALQYLGYVQLKKVKEHANQKEILLMGDLPILLSNDSVDVWQYPNFFIHNFQAGAPPDFYNTEGQNWGFPIFDWGAMRKNNFSWWKQRLDYAGNFYNLFRLDHVIGFFRIWAIPPGYSCKEGHYIPLDEKEWGPQGTDLLTMITTSTPMLPIAEDLGVVPNMVRPCLKEMGICATKVMRWERNWEGDHNYIPIQHYPPISLTCVSTHDSETLALWWKNLPDEAKAFADHKHWVYTENLTDAQREEILWDSHHTSSLFHVNLLQEYLAFFPELIWPNPDDERINIPGKILARNWTYRFRPSVEEIAFHAELFLKMKKIIHSFNPIT
jgi:4-alpha-glucanotransferase